MELNTWLLIIGKMFNLIHNKINAKQNSDAKMTKIRMFDNKRVWLRGNMHSCTLPVGVQTKPTSVKTNLAKLSKSKVEISLDSVTPLLETHLIGIFAYE